MGRLGITYLEVAKAATELQDKGLHPTVDAVRGILGTGSKSTIAPYLKQWRARNSPSPELPSPDLPPELLNLVKEWHQQNLKTKLADLQIKNEMLSLKLAEAERQKSHLINQKAEIKKSLLELKGI